MGGPPPPPPPGPTVTRINCGGPEVVAGGYTWSADQYFTGGSTFSENIPILNTTLDELYQTERNGDPTYEIPVAGAGLYEVRIHLAEIYWGPGGGPSGSGRRVFDLDVEGQGGLTNYDINNEVGPATAVVHTFIVVVSDGAVSIDLTTIVDNVKVSAIEVSPAMMIPPP